jgi:hypothetical protein
MISCANDPGYIQTFISFTLFDLSNRKHSPKSISGQQHPQILPQSN